MIKELKIKNIVLSNNTILAPIAGFSDVGFRAVCKKYGAGLTVTEMVSAKGLVFGSKKTEEILATSEREDVCAAQIFASEVDIIAKAVQHSSLQKFDIIDLNCGCPVPKIVGNGEGSALLKNIPLAIKLVQTAKENCDKAITVKFRKGFAINENIAIEFAQAMEFAGADAIAIHGRTREQYYSGKADWECIAEAKKSVKIPVIANGDILSREDCEQVTKITNCDGLMIARGALGNPSIFAEILGLPFEKSDKVDIEEQIELSLKHYPERIVASEMKKHICYYAKGAEHSKKIKFEICKTNNLKELLQVVRQYFQ